MIDTSTAKSVVALYQGLRETKGTASPAIDPQEALAAVTRIGSTKLREQLEQSQKANPKRKAQLASALAALNNLEASGFFNDLFALGALKPKNRFVPPVASMQPDAAPVSVRELEHPGFRPANKPLRKGSLAWRQERSGVKPMGVAGGVTRLAPGELYRDAETVIGRIDAPAGAKLGIGGSPRPQFFVVGSGSALIDGKEVHAGQLLALAPNRAADVTAGARGVRGFICELEGSITPAPATSVHPRVPLAPFDAEQIIVPAGTPFAFGDVFNLGEVLVPPGVTTSQHDVGVNERYLMMGGPATMFIDGVKTEVQSGDIVHIPSGGLQNIKNDSGAALRFYCLCTPPFVPETYGAGPVAGSGPEGFDLKEWWNTNASDFPAPKQPAG